MSGPNLEPPALPEGWQLDPLCEQVGAPTYWWVITDTGLRTSWNGEDVVHCPVCQADPKKMPDCSECVGRGRVDHIPFAPRPWDEVLPGLWLGGHDCQPEGFPPDGHCLIKPEDGFDVVISLFQRWGNTPPLGVEHHTYRIADADLDPEHHSGLDELARIVVEAVKAGEKVLVRCQAGLNRSALVVALAMLREGYAATQIISHLRDVRSPYVLCNQSFVDYILEKDGKPL
jgi:hypothetical protein